MKKIAFLGVGAMGARMAGRLLDAGYDVTLFNRTVSRCQPLLARGGVLAKTPRDATLGADLVISMLRDDAACQSVWLDSKDGALQGVCADSLVLECSTVTPQWIATLGEGLKSRGVELIDGPVAGSRPQAEVGQLIFLLGGEAKSVARLSPLLSHLGSKFLHVGPLGAGIYLKLALNAFFALQVAGLGELLPFLQQAGVPQELAADLLGQTPVVSPAAQGAMAQMTAGVFDPLFPIDLVDKDLVCALDAALALEQPLPLTYALRGVFNQAKQEGLGEKNISGITLLHQKAA